MSLEMYTSIHDLQEERCETSRRGRLPLSTALVGDRRKVAARLAVRDSGPDHPDVLATAVIETEAPASSTTAQAESPEPVAEFREITDPRELRAMTHPVRLALLEALALNEALTATEAGELIGESATTCSFHLRQLAKYGFVEEAGDAPGRRRPWKLAIRRVQFSSATGDPELGAASVALENLLVQRWFDRLAQWQRTRTHYAREWQAAAIGLEHLLHVTPSELLGIQEEIVGILDRFQDRVTDPSQRPAQSQPIEFLSFGFPFMGGRK